MMKNKKHSYKLLFIVFIYLGTFNVTSTEQDITLNNPTSFPVDI